MKPAPIPEDEERRLAALERMNLLSTPREADLDRITRTAGRFMNAEIALISLVDKDRQWFKSRYGLEATETERSISFCGHAIVDDRMLVVPDATTDDRFFDNPLVVGGPEIRFYAGHPITTEDGHRIGTLCVISSTPKTPDEGSLETLADLARMTEIILQNRKLTESQKALLESLSAAQRDNMIDPLTGVWNRRGLAEMLSREISRARRESSSILLAVCDVDHFKRINDTFGHVIGDAAIKLTAQILVETCRSADVVARFGGEEFVIVMPGVDRNYIAGIGEKILQSFRRKAVIRVGEVKCSFTTSIGFSVFDPQVDDEDGPDKLIERADKALYEAKTGGRDRFHVAPCLERA